MIADASDNPSLTSLLKFSVISLTGDTRVAKGQYVQFRYIQVISLALLETSLSNKIFANFNYEEF